MPVRLIIKGSVNVLRPGVLNIRLIMPNNSDVTRCGNKAVPDFHILLVIVCVCDYVSDKPAFYLY